MTPSSPTSSKPAFVDAKASKDGNEVSPSEELFGERVSVASMLTVLQAEIAAKDLTNDEVMKLFDLAGECMEKWGAETQKLMWENIASLSNLGVYGEDEAVRRSEEVKNNDPKLRRFYEGLALDFGMPGN